MVNGYYCWREVCCGRSRGAAMVTQADVRYPRKRSVRRSMARRTPAHHLALFGMSLLFVLGGAAHPRRADPLWVGFRDSLSRHGYVDIRRSAGELAERGVDI